MKKISKILVSLTSAIFVLSLVIAPVSGFAKENNRENEGKGRNSSQEKHDKKDEKKDNKENRKEDRENDHKKNSFGCFTQFGHFIASGWIKHNGERFFDESCHLPFGIWKRIGGGNGMSSTTPVVLPTISSIDVLTSKSAALVRWTTNTKTNSKVFYSLTAPVDVNASSTKSVASNSRVKNHQIYIGGLTADTTYHSLVVSRDAQGNTATSSEFTFQTKILSGDITAPIISNVVPMVSTSTLAIGWTTDEPATSKVYYGTSSLIDVNASTTQYVDNTALQTGHTVTISGLASSTTYYYVIESIDGSANVRRTSVLSATTNAQPAPIDSVAPVISNIVTTIGSTTLGFTWNTNENSTTKVYYSTSTPVDTATTTTPFVENVTLVSGHAITITSLATSTLYHVILESKDASNNKAQTSELNFTTTSGI